MHSQRGREEIYSGILQNITTSIFMMFGVIFNSSAPISSFQ
jgi:hypothetical protein